MGNPKVNLHEEEYSVKIKVKCPTCQKIHEVKMYWTGGRVMPRIRCNSCKSSVKNKNQGLPIYTNL
jgi:phage FluMu protein Com